MKLSQVKSFLEEKEKEKEEVDLLMGIEVDEYLTPNLDNIKTVTFIGNHEEDDEEELSLDTLDVLIAASKGKMNEVILEIPYGNKFSSEEHVSQSYTIGYSLAILPPKGDLALDEKAWEEYTCSLEDYTKEWFKIENNSQFVYPISSYLQYMILDHYGNAPKTLATDPFIISRFVDGVDVEVMDKMKLRLKEAILTQFGGQEGFDKYLPTLLTAIKKGIAEKIEAAHKEMSNK